MNVIIRWIDPVGHQVRLEPVHRTTEDALKRIHGHLSLTELGWVGSVIDHDTDYERDILSQKGVGK